MCSATDTNSAFENTGPVALRDLWLRFHEKEWCQDLDAVFNFYPKGMEVWCLVEDERSYQRFSDMIAPLKSSFEIVVYATRLAAEKKSDDEKEPPPSLWNNTELHSSLEITARDILLSPGQGGRGELSELPRQSLVKQRLVMWAAQMLGWRKKVERYAADLPELARLGFGPGGAKEIRSHAAVVCLSHAQALDKNLAHIMDGMAQALPKPEKGTRRPSEAAKPRMPSSPVDLAAQASAESLSLARRVYRFIYPQEYTVGVTDLKDPALLESLRELRKMLTELQRFSGGARQALP